jgi:D-tyrosyl-tRNA(Tyr) deacylase
MLAVVQRVSQARVEVDQGQGLEVVGRIGPGLLVLVCAEPGDSTAQVHKLIDKVLKLRIFGDEAGKMNLSVQDVAGGLLIVSQFTLAADCSAGNRPSFTGAAGPERGRALYEAVLDRARSLHPDVAAGIFGADMKLHLVNDGPVTIPLTLR